MKIIFRDEHVLIVDKPSGLSVLPEGWDKDAPYLVKMLEEKFKKIWVVHRIDKSTSGIVIFALTTEAHRSLNIQFEKHNVEKTYHAIITGVPYWTGKTARFPLRVNVGHKHRTIVDNRLGVGSETRFKLMENHQSSALVEAMPMTGRTHQIRVHAYALGHPLLGDVLYSGPESDVIKRPALHAFSLSFNHPNTKERMEIRCPYPYDFENALRLLRRK